MDFGFKLITSDKKVRARAGEITTPHGVLKTPCFTPVATRASVRTLSIDDVKNVKSQAILSNTYHLYLKPGVDVIKEFNGFASFMGWEGPTITDSGGYQVSFLWDKGDKEKGQEDYGKLIKITDEGAVFSSYIDGSRHLLSPEKSMEIQSILASDIIMAFDHPMGSSKKIGSEKEAFERTLKWEERSLIAWEKNKKKSIQDKFQALYGIVQGETDKNVRKKSIDFVLKMDFPGIAIGGESIGSDPKVTAKALDTISDLLPDDKPTHALGLGGGPEGIFEAIERGIDTFDNTGITRMARTGLLFISPIDGGNIKNKFRKDVKKIDPMDKTSFSKDCGCEMCTKYNAGYVKHLFNTGEILALRLASIHNIYFVNSLMEKIRESILNNSFLDLKKDWLK